MMRVYIAGPMTGIPQFNIPAFDTMAALLRLYGYDVVSPAELDGPETRAILMRSLTGARKDYPAGMTHGDFLSRDVKLIADDGIEGIVVLPGWSGSKGARHETFVAHLNGLPTLHLGEPGKLIPVPPLALYRAWTGDRTLRLAGTFGRAL